MYMDYFAYAKGVMVVLFLLYLIAIVGGVVLHFTFLSDKNEGVYEGALGKIYDFLTFRRLCIESILRLFYIITVCILVITAIVVLFMGFFSNFGVAFLGSLGILVFGNLIARIGYELSLLSVLMCKNIIDINRKLGSGKNIRQSVFQEDPSAQEAEPAPETEKSAYCRNCGAKIERADSAFCTKCGHPR